MTFIISNPLRIGSGVSASLPSDALRVRSISAASTASTPQTAAHDAVRDAANEIISALGQYAPPVPVYSGPTVARAALVSALNGRIARTGTVGGTASTLATTSPINTEATTNRRSALALGLNLSTAVSVLRSAGLGLDVTSPTAASSLSSAGSLGLDVTSPAAASLLASSTALGLDLNSPNAPSILSSARALGLDLTSPETASKLYSSALGLDLTSPDAASVLKSALTLGLDITSPETVSKLASSGALGLDVTSAEVASRLTSSGTLGLDVTSPSLASVLTSASRLGLDLTSPDAVSHVTSSSAVGLDTTSPETASQLSSSALGLDLTSPNAASKLSSSAGLGLDITSPQATSVLSSSAVLGLDVTTPQASSTISSMAAVNTATTNYDPSVTFANGTSVATLSGTYTGTGTAANTSQLTIKWASNATLSSTASTVHFQIMDGSTKLLDYQGSLKAGDKVYLGDNLGLYVSFSAGTAKGNDTGTSSVSHVAPTVDPTAAFVNSNPDLQPKFDNGRQVSAGSFTINGTTINVAATDSINSVISTINASAAGVTASWNATTEKLTLTTNNPSEDNIFLANDTSGFLAAMKLTSPNEQINTATTSYTSNAKFASSNSTAAISLTGTYLGTGAYAGATSLKIKVQSLFGNSISATSAGNVQFQVLDQNNKTLDSFSVSVKAGDKIQLGNETGLWLSFSAGQIAANDTATVAVSNTVGTDVDPTAAFNATGNSAPKWDPGYSVGAGSFTVNGVTINVAATDTINSVLAKINASAAGVTATLANDQISVVNNTGTNPVILGNDTSGFLAATKIATAITTKGNVRDDLQVLSKTTQFASVTNGSFSINGTAISVNTVSDSVSTIVSRINANSSTTHVTAAYDSAKDKIVLTSTANSEDLITVSNDTSGFAAAAKLATNNTVIGNIRDDQQFLSKTTQFGSVATGSFTINGVSISVNKDTDTLTTIMNRINASAAGVTATFDGTNNKLVLTGTSNSEDLITVGGDTSGFLTAAKLSTGNTVRGHISEDGVALYDLSRFSAVTNGSFVVDGHTINVATSDTINSIVSKINASGARVTAAFDSTSNKIKLTTTYNTEDLVSIGSDTSGFLSAAGIASANTVKGNIKDDQQYLSKTTQFSGVASGNLSINGTSISVNKDTDTLDTVIARINASAAGVTAAYDAGTDKLTLTNTTNSEDLIALSDDTGLLSDLHLSTANTVRGHLSEDGVALYDLSNFQSVTNGSFVVDGKTINVSTGDTINSIVSRINTSGARVTASYDTANDKLVLTTTYDTEDLVQVGSDTSGFLAAAHLDTNNTQRGNLPDDQQVLAKTTQFGQVSSGSVTVNGATISIDPNNDTLSSILAKINASPAGVTASYDAASDTVSLVSNAPTEDLITVSDNTGFLTAAKLATQNTVRGNIRDDEQVFSKTTQFGDVSDGSFTINGTTIAVNAATDTLNTLIARINGSGAGVTASYDATADVIRLATTSNTEDLITVGNDTSGFLADAKLDTSNTQRGNIRDDQQLLAKTTQFGGVTAGSFTINGVSIAVDPNADTLTTLVDRINGANAGVTAAYDSIGDKLVLTGTADSEDLIDVGGDSSGFLDAAHLETANTERGHLPEDGVVLADLSRFQGVSAGSFTVDGKTIEIDPTADTIQSIVQKINDSGARVTAAYDPDTNKIGLTTTYNTEDQVAIGGDTSGFLSAAGIDSSNTLVGNIRDDEQVLAKTSQFGTVSSGSFTVNGATIAIDAQTDTLQSVVGKINASNAGVTAAYDSTNDVLRLTANANGEDLIDVGNDTTGFLAAASLDTSNTVRGHLPEDGVVLQDLASFSGVTNGSFDVDGQTINVDVASDTIQSLVDKINNSGARVVASYDGGSDKITLDATYDSEDDVPVGNDTSGFLAAAHLDPSNTQKGNIADDQQVLAKTSQFGSVTSGSFTIDGTTIAIDANADSLQDIIGRINSSGAGVTASFDANANVVRLVGTRDSEDLIDVGNDSTGFLSAAKLDSSNTVRGNLHDDQQVLAKTSQFGQVQSGTFSLNGTSIAVDVNTDTVESLIQKMNDAGAGVTAAYDADQDRIVLTSQSIGQDLVSVSGDTTGFLAAAGLDTANGVAGKLADDNEVFSRTSQFAQVSDGSFSIDGHAIAVSVSTDSLESVLDKINSANVGVTASYDNGSDTVTFTPNVAGATLAIDNDTSGFFNAIHVSQGDVGTRVNVDAQFNATGLDAPLFDTGLSVGAGSFTVNGVQIDVAADDSVSSVLAKITASNAGVNATYDTGSQTVRLQAKNLAAAPITLGADTSGFLAAVKLDGTAQSTPGADPISTTALALSTMDEYAGVKSGTLTVNGSAIHIDPASTTLDDVVQQLNAMKGIVASVDNQTGLLSIKSKPGAASFHITDTSGLLKKIGITPPVVVQRPKATDGPSNATTVAQSVATAVSSLNQALANYGVGGASVNTALAGTVDMLSAAGAKGLSINAGIGAPQVSVNQDTLAASLDAGGALIAAEFAQSNSLVSVLESLVDRFATVAGSVAHTPSSSLTDAVKASFMSSGG